MTPTIPHTTGPPPAQPRDGRMAADVPGRADAARTGDRTLWQQRGSATVELVIATPLVLLLLGLIVQAAVWSHAEHIAQAAAARGTEAARASGATPAAGHRQAQDTLDALGGALRDPAIQVTRTATTTRTQIRGSALSVLPGVHLSVTAVAEAPTERFVPDTAPADAGGAP